MTLQHFLVEEKDILTGVQANKPLVNTISNDPLVAGGANEFFEPTNLSNEAPVFTFYVNGIRTSLEDYQDTVPLIDNLLSEAGIDSRVEFETYNPTGPTLGAGDLLEAGRQILSNIRGLRFLDTEDGQQLVQNIVEEMQAIDEALKRQAEENCQDIPRAKFLFVGHSQGNFFLEKIAQEIEAESPEIAERTKLFAISSFTSFRNTSVEVGYLLRDDDITDRLSANSERWPRFSEFLATPGNANVPELPTPFKGSGPLASHALENYLDPSQAIPRNQAAVIESFNSAQDIIHNLLDFDSGFYEKDEDCEPEEGTEVVVRILDSTNPYTIKELFLASPERSFVATPPSSVLGIDGDFGKDISLGTFTPGTELIFELEVLPLDRNGQPVGPEYAVSSNSENANLFFFGGLTPQVEFEDGHNTPIGIFDIPESLSDYNDARFQIIRGVTIENNSIIVI